jgi:tetratricopeptide (TPR) repeat protein
MKYLSNIVLILALILFAAGLVRAEPGGDVWTRVESKNFLLIGNASEKDIRKVGTRLEQFRETFRMLFGKIDLSASIPTTVIVFKNDAAYRNFKPKRSDGKIDNFIAGFFQPGEDENFITLSAEGGDDSKLDIIFHEYVHFIINTNFGKSKVPAWFNEGMAEYYETFSIENNQKIKLGLPQSRHLAVLRDSTLIPLRTIFGTSNAQLLEMPDRPRAVFYAESWALVHCLTHTGRASQLNKFFQALIRDTAPEAAFKEAFGSTYDQMEAELKSYVAKFMFSYNELALPAKLTFDDQMSASIIDGAESNAYLGDLLYHMNRTDDAEPLLIRSLADKPASSMANTTLAMVRMRQERFDEATKYFESAIAADARNHLAYYGYAYLLSRQGSGSVQASVTPDQADKMRRALNKAIEIAPWFTESYDLMAFVDLVRNEQVDQALAGMQKALRYQPGSQRYALRIAEIYAMQNKLGQADVIARKIAGTADDADTRRRAISLTEQIARHREVIKQNAAERKAESAEEAALRKSNEAEAAAAEDPYAVSRSISQALRKLMSDEKRVIGSIVSIDCGKKPLAFLVKTPQGSFTVTSDTFESLNLGAFTAGSDQRQVGCDEDLSKLNAVITYRPDGNPKGGSRGVLVSIEFVPADFQFLDPLPMSTEMLRKMRPDPNAATGPLMDPPRPRTTEEQRTQQRMLYQAIRDSLPKPAGAEKQDIGFLDRVECTGSGAYFVVRTGSRTLRLINSSPASVHTAIFATEAAGLRFGCSAGPIAVPAVFIYLEHAGSDAGSDGDLVALSYVPKGFTIEP